MRNIFKAALMASCLLMLFTELAYGQRTPIRIRTEYKSSSGSGDIVFSAENPTREDYHVVVRFKNLLGFRCTCSQPFGMNIKTGTTRLFNLIGNQSEAKDYNYTWSYWKGRVARKIKEVDYLIPLAPGKKVEVMKLQSISEFLGKDDEDSNEFYGIGFTVNPGDTIYASRSGYVSEIEDRFEAREGETVNFTVNNNSITIVSKDDSYIRYSVLKKGGMLVKKNEEVEAGQPIAIAGGEDYASGPQVRMLTYYTLWDRKNYNRYYIKNKFVLENGQAMVLEPGEEYTSTHPLAAIVQDMTKKQAKKYLKAHGQ